MAAPSLTYTLTNGSTADASQVMQNFNDLLNGITDGTKDLSISALTCAGTATLNGHVNLGNSSSDDIIFNGTVASAVVPKTTGVYALGSTSFGYSGLYLGANSQRVRVAPSASLAATYDFTLPTSGGTSGYALTTNGSGTTSWTEVFNLTGNQTAAGDKTFSGAVALSGGIALGDGGTLTLADSDTSVGTDELLGGIRISSADASNASGTGARFDAYSRSSTGGTTGFSISAAISGSETVLVSSDANGVVNAAVGLSVPTSSTSGNIYSNKYTPTVTNVTGLSVIAVQQHNFIRVGSIVHVTGWFTATYAGGGVDASATVTLPVTTANFNTSDEAQGVAAFTRSATAIKEAGIVFATTGAQTVTVQVESSAATNTTGHNMSYTFSYEIQ